MTEATQGKVFLSTDRKAVGGIYLCADCNAEYIACHVKQVYCPACRTAKKTMFLKSKNIEVKS